MAQGLTDVVIDPANLFKVTPSTPVRELAEAVSRALVDTPEVVLQTIGPEGVSRAVKVHIQAGRILSDHHNMSLAGYPYWATLPGSRGEAISAVMLRLVRSVGTA